MDVTILFVMLPTMILNDVNQIYEAQYVTMRMSVVKRIIVINGSVQALGIHNRRAENE